MSGHSKWSTIKRQKGALDAKRGVLFTKLANNIAIAAAKGNDPEANSSLRMAIDAARQANMPKANIERAIKRGSGELEGAKLEQILYEGFGPEGVGVLIDAITDNRNRTVAEIKKLLQLHRGNLGGSGSVQWMFERLGMLELPSEASARPDWEELELRIIDAGASNIEPTPDVVQITTPLDDLMKIKKQLEDMGLTILTAEPTFVPKETTTLTPDAQQTLDQLIESLDDHPNVNAVSTTAATPK